MCHHWKVRMPTEWSPFDDLGEAMNPPKNPPKREQVPDHEDYLKAMDAKDPLNRPMDEIKMGLDYKARYDLADLGSRYQHLSELTVLWEDTVEAMKSRKFLGRDEMFKLHGIELALKQLKKTIEGLQGYREYVGSIADLVNQVPKAFSIFGGRGTAIKPYEPLGGEHEEMT
jgi:hypothetical protein